MTHPYSLTAITGGIGAGKSVVSRILTVMGLSVYDCDTRAKTLMSCNRDIIDRIACEISSEAIAADGTVNRQRLSSIVFADTRMLCKLNAIVHHHVREDLRQWCLRRQESGERRLFVETAILRESGLDAMVDSVWHITADTETRIRRVMARNRMSRENVMSRIRSQSDDARYGVTTHVIVNDGKHPLLPVIITLINNS